MMNGLRKGWGSLRENWLGDFSRVRRQVSGAWRHRLGIVAWLIALAAVATFINWVVTTAGTGFEEIPPEVGARRTLWDWFGLLLIPVVLGVTGLVFNLLLQRRTFRENETDREIALDRSRAETLRHYLDTMQSLILERKLKHGAEEDVRHVARARTIAAIRVLDASRVDQLIDFLRDAALIDVVDEDGRETSLPAVTLAEADLREARIPGVNFSYLNLSDSRLDSADLSGAYLEGTNLNGANLGGASLRGAVLERANMTNSNLEGADLSSTSLEEATLRGAQLEGANLRDSDLGGADLETAIGVTQDQLDAVASLDGTKLPSGTTSDDLPTGQG